MAKDKKNVMAKGKKTEIVTIELPGRGKSDLLDAVNKRMQEFKKTGGDFKSLNMGFELPEKFLMLNGPQPALAQLTVLCNKLKMRLKITHLELEPLDGPVSL